MKTTIDSKQAERLKEVCEKYGVMLPKYIEQYSEWGNEFTTWKENDYNDISITDLLDWLPKEIEYKGNILPLNISYDVMYGVDNGENRDCAYCGYESFYAKTGDTEDVYYKYDNPNNFQSQGNGLLIDALFELFIWTIENGYYKGVI